MLLLLVVLTVVVSYSYSCNGLLWEGGHWAIACDFPGNDLAHIRSRVQNCEVHCVSTHGCTHFTWTKYKGGTCWMKRNRVSRNDAIETTNLWSVCGIIENNKTADTLHNIRAIRYNAHEAGACALPEVRYDVHYPVALGDVAELKHLKFTPELCGHVLTVNCSHGNLDIIISNLNLGGGLDLYGSSWDILTNSQPPRIATCSVELSNRNAMPGGAACYYKPGTDHHNRQYHNVGLLNTNDKLVTSAVIGGKIGAHRGDNPYFAFDGEVDDNDVVTFGLDDGSKQSVKLRDCIYLHDAHLWS